MPAAVHEPTGLPLLRVNERTGLPITMRRRSVGMGRALSTLAVRSFSAAGNLFADVLSIVAPTTALRMQLSHDLYMKRRGLGAETPADYNRLSHHRVPHQADPDGEYGGKQGRIRAFAREEVRNNPTARNLKRTHAVNVIGDADVGPGFTVDPDVLKESGDRDESINKAIKAAWQKYRDKLDFTGRWGFTDLLVLADSELTETGEVLAILHDKPALGSDLPFSVELIEADRLPWDNDLWMQTASGVSGLNEFILADENGMPVVDGKGAVVKHHVKNGIEYDQDGRIVAYHILADHPGSHTLWARSFKTRRIPAENVIHYFRPDRAEQTRGVSTFMSALGLLQSMRDLIDWELIAAKCQAIFGVHFGGPVDNLAAPTNASSTPTDANGNQVTQLQPGMITMGGARADFYQGNRPGNTFLPFFQSLQRLAGAAFGIGYSATAKDWSTGSYSSLRQETNEDERVYQSDQGLHARHFVKKTWHRFIRALVLIGKLPAVEFNRDPDRFCRHAINTPGPKHINPLQEITAEAVALAAGIKGPDEVLNESGMEPEDRLRSIARYVQLAASLGVPLSWVIGKPKLPINSQSAIGTNPDSEANGDLLATQMQDESADVITGESTDETGTVLDDELKPQEQAMNGAQVQALQAVIQSVADGQLPAESAKLLITSAFQTLPQADVNKMVDAAANFKPTTVTPSEPVAAAAEGES